MLRCPKGHLENDKVRYQSNVDLLHISIWLYPNPLGPNVDSGMEEYLTPGEVAQRLRVDDYTLRRWIRTGALDAESTQEGRRVRYRIKKSVVEAIERRDPERHRRLV